MKARLDAGTDVAMIGAWDAERNATPLTPEERRDVVKTLEGDAAAGRLFLIHTGSDGGGPVHLYIGEAIPAGVQASLEPIARDALLSVPSGKLMVGGMEYYRSTRPGIIGTDSVVSVPAGDYAARLPVHDLPDYAVFDSRPGSRAASASA